MVVIRRTRGIRVMECGTAANIVKCQKWRGLGRDAKLSLDAFRHHAVGGGGSLVLAGWACVYVPAQPFALGRGERSGSKSWQQGRVVSGVHSAGRLWYFWKGIHESDVSCDRGLRAR